MIQAEIGQGREQPGRKIGPFPQLSSIPIEADESFDHQVLSIGFVSNKTAGRGEDAASATLSDSMPDRLPTAIAEGKSRRFRFPQAREIGCQDRVQRE
jgi:hypothetical protein